MNFRGIAIYLVTAFVAGWFFQIAGLWSGGIAQIEANLLNTIVLVAVVLIPGLAALAARRLAPDAVNDTTESWPVPMGLALRVAVLVPAVFIVSNILTTLIGWSSTDWRMETLQRQLIDTGIVREWTPELAAVLPILTITAGLMLSILVGATLFAAVAYVHEMGWRGYLLPRLLVRLPRWGAYVLAGVAWAFWFAPMISDWYGRFSATGSFAGAMPYFVAMAIAFGAFLGEVWQRTRNLALVAIALGAFTGHFQQDLMSNLIIIGDSRWAGNFGIVTIVLWFIVAFFPQIILGRDRRGKTETPLVRGDTFSGRANAAG